METIRLIIYHVILIGSTLILTLSVIASVIIALEWIKKGEDPSSPDAE